MSRLFWKFFFGFVLALILASSAVYFYKAIKHRTDIEAISDVPIRLNRASTMAVSVASNIAEYGGRDALRNYLSDQREHRHRVIYAIDEHNRELLGRVVADESIHFARTLHSVQPQPSPVQTVTFADGSSVLLFQPASDYQRPSPSFQRRQPPPSLSMILFMGTLSGLIFSALLAWWFTKPIRLLRKAFNDVASGKLDTRLAALMGNRHDELAELGQHFDQMTDKLQKLIHAQQSLLHDVSHELRSPLARIQATIGLAQQQPEKTIETLDRIERETQRINTLIEDLLNLSRIETLSQQAVQPQDFDIVALIKQIIEDAQIEANRQHLQLHYSGLEKQYYHGYPELLLRAIENVVRNAIKFSPAHAAITIHCEQNATQNLSISVIDDGPGVQQDKLNAIFQPFYRVTNQSENSSGLGLTIAKRAVEAHHGKMTARNKQPNGLIVSLILPLLYQ